MLVGRIIVGTFTFTVVCSVAMIFTLNGIPTHTSDIYNYLTSVFYCLTGAACLLVLVLLITIIRKTFTNELNQEMKQLVISEVTFVVTFILRTSLIICV